MSNKNKKPKNIGKRLKIVTGPTTGMNRHYLRVPCTPYFKEKEEITVTKWYKKVGDTIEPEELILEIDSDTITMEINSPEGGILETRIKEGGVVTQGELLGIIRPISTEKQALDSIDYGVTKEYPDMSYLHRVSNEYIEESINKSLNHPVIRERIKHIVYETLEEMKRESLFQKIKNMLGF